MLYLIGLGLNQNSISKEGLEALKKCKRVYLEDYTVDFPYTKIQLEEKIRKKVISANREKVEDLSIVDEARKLNVALLIYGSPLTATTHITLIDECRIAKIKYRLIYNASIFDAIAETGLQLYKFGKVASMPAWKKSYTPDSFMKIIKENNSINAHSLILIDIGLAFNDALKQLKISAENYGIKLNKIVVCQAMGSKDRKIIYRKVDDMAGFEINPPYCIILPSKTHFVEKEVLNSFGKNK